jgi:hypothetical protein
MRNLHHGEPSSWSRHGRDPKEIGTDTPRCGSHDMPLMLPFQAPADTIRNTTRELHSVAAQYVTSNEAAQLQPALSNNREVSADAAIQDTWEGTQCGKKRRKQQPREVMTAAYGDGGNNKRANDSGVVHVVTTVGGGKH